MIKSLLATAALFIAFVIEWLHPSCMWASHVSWYLVSNIYAPPQHTPFFSLWVNVGKKRSSCPNFSGCPNYYYSLIIYLVFLDQGI